MKSRLATSLGVPTPDPLVGDVVMPRKPWETPIEYNDTRWEESPPNAIDSPQSGIEGLDERDKDEVEELMSREPREEKEYECNDDSPLDYGRGPHDDELDTEDRFDQPDDIPVPYGNGPHEEVLDDDDEDEDDREIDDDDRE
jgi:hypothetical protein